jgi:hypothetical protein
MIKSQDKPLYIFVFIKELASISCQLQNVTTANGHLMTYTEHTRRHCNYKFLKIRNFLKMEVKL